MEQHKFSILENVALTEQVSRMVLAGPTGAITAPGQFVQISLPGFYLRRPISVCDWEEGKLTLVYKAVGEGTTLMQAMESGVKLDILVGLGNGYNTEVSGDRPVLLGGGVGVPPIYGLAKRLVAEGKHPQVILGFNAEKEIFFREEFEALGVPVTVTTVDGSVGMKGFVTDAMKTMEYTHFYACGPLPMLKAIEKTAVTGGQYSFEERMGCGFGACMGCAVETKNGVKRVCADGPVFSREVVLL